MSKNQQQQPLPDIQTPIERAEARAEQAEARAEQAEMRTEQAETRTEQAITRTEFAETRAEQAETRTEFAKTRAEKAEIRTEKAETRAEHAESALEGLIQKEVEEPPHEAPSMNLTDDQRALERLTLRQQEILGFIARGENTKHIADLLNLSPKTVEYHRMKLMHGLNLYDIPGLVRFALRVGLASPEG